jgi:DNA-binding NtrC family response regulator
MLESQLFGYRKGAFTGADTAFAGVIRSAEGGTLFLDEIADVPIDLQPKLLRFLETHEIHPLGEPHPIKVDVRVIAATNANLDQLVAQGRFREDLFYRLNVVQLMVPSLAERREDIPQLIEHFLTRFSNSGKYLARRMSPEAEDLLLNYSWPGNVRELENVVERLVVTGRNETVQPDDLPLEIRAHNGISLRPKRERRRTVSDDLFKKIVDDRESFWTVVYPRYMQREITKSQVREVVRKGLEQSRGNYKIVARMFNMDESEYKRFLNFLRKHDCQLPFKDYRQ